jgi:hypothetical protein
VSSILLRSSERGRYDADAERARVWVPISNPARRIVGRGRGYVARVDRRTSLDELFERFESLPSQDAEGAKAELVERMLATVAERLAGVEPDDERYRPVRAAAARVRLLGSGAAGFDEAVLELIDAARERLDEETLAEGVVVASPAAPGPVEPAGEVVTEASEESFPASDAPGYAAGRDGSR